MPFRLANQVIAEQAPKVFGTNWPIFDEGYRAVLENKILTHYYMREIGFETVPLWMFKLQAKMNELMPYYNEIYKSALYDFNPLWDTDYTRKHEGEKKDSKQETGNTERNGSTNYSGESTNNGEHSDENSSTSTGTENHTNKVTDTYTDDSWEYFNDTPQGGIDGIQSQKYLTSATNRDNQHTGSSSDIGDSDTTNRVTGTASGTSKDTSTNAGRTGFNDTSENTVNGSYNSTDSYLETVKGKMGGQSYATMIIELRETFLNIDMLVIRELEDLFMGVW